MEKRSRLIASEVRAAEENEKKQISAYFAVFDDNYEFAPGCSESIAPTAFDSTLNDDIRALINHDTTLVLGRTSAGTLTLKTDSHGLYGTIDINPDDQEALNLYARVQRKDVSQCSIGFDIVDETMTDLGGKYHWTINQIKLYEVSVVTFPAYESTEANARDARRSQMFDLWKKRTKERLTNGIKKADA